MLIRIADTTRTLWRDLSLLVLEHAKGVPLPLLDKQVAESARHFLERSHAWRTETFTMLTTVASQELYTPTVPADAEVYKVHAAWDGEDEVNAQTPGQEHEDTYPGKTDSTWDIGVEPGNVLRLTPLPNAAGDVVKGVVSLVPIAAATGIPTAIFRRWSRNIAAHAAAMLVMQPEKPWSNPGTAGALMTMFNQGVRQASNEAGPVRRKPLRVTPL